MQKQSGFNRNTANMNLVMKLILSASGIGSFAKAFDDYAWMLQSTAPLSGVNNKSKAKSSHKQNARSSRRKK